MKNYDALLKKALKAHKQFFEDFYNISLDNENITSVERQIGNSKIEAEAHMRMLSKLKQDLENDAKKHEAKYFPQEHQEKEKINEMFNEYLDAQKRLFNLSQKVAIIKRNARK